MVYFQVPQKYYPVYQTITDGQYFFQNLNRRNLRVTYNFADTPQEYGFRVNSQQTGNSFFPINLTGFNISKWATLVEEEQAEEHIEQLNSIDFETLNDNEIYYRHYFVDKVDTFKEAVLGTGLFVAVSEAVQTNLNKFTSQQELREGRGITGLKMVVLRSKVKHMIICIQNFYEDRGEDLLALIGNTPKIFEDLDAKLPPKSKAFYGEMVRRSCLKHFLNGKMKELFDEAMQEDVFPIDVEAIIEEQTLRNMLNARKRSLSNRVYSFDRQIEDTLNNYQSLLKQKRDAQIILDKVESNENSFIEEYKMVKSLEGIKQLEFINNSELVLWIRTKLVNFEPSLVECMLHNIQNRLVRKIFEDLFVKQKYKVNIAASFRYNCDASGNTNLQNPSRLSPGFLQELKALANPHYQYFNCIGSYATDLIKAQNSGDLFAFANIAINATGAVNFADSPVVRNWADQLDRELSDMECYNDADNYRYQEALINIKAIEDENGDLYTLNELYILNVKGDLDETPAQTLDLFDTVDETNNNVETNDAEDLERLHQQDEGYLNEEDIDNDDEDYDEDYDEDEEDYDDDEETVD